MWNVYELSLNDEDRTKNNAEDAHGRLQNELGMQHPTVWKFTDCLKKSLTWKRPIFRAADHRARSTCQVEEI